MRTSPGFTPPAVALCRPVVTGKFAFALCAGILMLLSLLTACTRPVHADTWRAMGHNGGDGRSFGKVWMASATEGWVVGDEGIIRHTTDGGQTWVYEANNSTPAAAGFRILNAVAGSDASHVMAVGVNGQTNFYDGTSWSQQASGTSSRLNSVWAADSTHIWAVGNGGTIIFWNGSSWSTQTSGTTNNLTGVWGTDANNVWAVGASGTIRKWNGTSWSGQTSGTTVALNAVWGTDGSNVWAVGAASAGAAVIRKFDGTSWNAQTSGTASTLTAIWGTDGSHIWAGGNNGVIRFFDGTNWTGQTGASSLSVNGIFAVNNTNVWAVTATGIIQKFDGTNWSLQISGPSSSLYSVWGTSANNAWTVGGGGIIYRWNGSLWVPQTSGVTTPLRTVWGLDSNNVWAGGDQGVILKWNGTSWNAQSSGLATTMFVLGLWGTDANNVWAVASSGNNAANAILKWDGSNWTPQTVPVTNGLYAIWGADASNIWAVGASGTILKYDGTNWTTQTSGTATLLRSVWGADANNVWAVGHSGVIRKFDGTSWSGQSSPTLNNLHSVWGIDATNLFIAGNDDDLGNIATIMKGDGTNWTLETPVTRYACNGVWGSDTGHVFVVGDTGLIQSNFVVVPNTVPTATNLTQTKTYTEGAASVALDDIVVTDPDSNEVITATLALANPATGSLSTSGTATYTAGTGVWTITGTVTNVNTALEAVAFIPATDNDVDTTIATLIADDSNAGPAVGTITLDVTGTNDAPANLILTATPDPQDEGSTVMLDGSFNDVDTGDTQTAVIDWGDGSTNTTVNVGAGVLGFTGETHTYDDNGTYTISVTVTDVGTLSTTETTPITIDNVAPTATFGNGGDVALGDTGTVTFTAQTDPSTADTTAGFRYAYDFNNDNDFTDTGEIGDGTYAGSSTSASVTVPASFLNAIGSATVRGVIIDKDGGVSEYTTLITVNETASLIVTTTQDVVDPQDGLRSLREVISTANSNVDASAITFDIAGAGPHVVQLDSALPDLTTAITITGPIDESVTVRGEGATDPYRIFTIAAGQTVAISYLTLSNGYGAIANNGTLTVSNSTVSGNLGVLSGGGIFNDATGTLNISNSTISGNTSTTNSGGGIANFGTLNVSYSTLTNNTAFNGGGIFNNGAALFTLLNSIVAGNSATTNANITGSPTGTGNVVDVDAKLAPLADNGGPTQTHALLFGSPALNAVNDISAPVTDQRGLPRPVGLSDSGAFEVQMLFSISGYVRTGSLAPLPGVSVQVSTASGSAGTPVTTDANGFYQVTGVPPGGYLVTPSRTGWTFAPAAQSIVVTNAGRGANFIATRTAASYSISGRISTSDGQAIVGASVALLPEEGGVFNPVLTNSAGYYTFNGVPDGDYTVTPTKTGFTFTPPNRMVTVAAASVSGRNFTGVSGHTLSGRIMTAGGAAIAGVTVTRTGTGTTTTVTNSAGYYTFINVPDGDIVVTPTKSGYLFTPGSKTVPVSGADALNQNFIGATGYTVTGRIATSSGAAIADVTVTLDGGATAATNSAGYYTFQNVANGNHTVEPSKSGYTFAPPTRTITVNNANLPNQNFTGTGP